MGFIKSSSLSEVKKSFIEEKRSLSSMFLESSPSESFIKSSSFLNWNRSLSLKRKPSLSELSPHFKASLSAHHVFLSEENHRKSFNGSFVAEKKSFFQKKIIKVF